MRSAYDHGREQYAAQIPDPSSKSSDSSSEASNRTRSTRSSPSEASYQSTSSKSSSSERSYRTLLTEYSSRAVSEKVHHAATAGHASASHTSAPSTQALQGDYFGRTAVNEEHQLTSRPKVIIKQEESPPVSHDIQHQRQSPSTERYFDDRHFQDSPTSSVQSFTSTLVDEEEVDEPTIASQLPECPDRVRESSSAIAATPSDFSYLFPSDLKMLVHHDDSTDDGNMNLRVDTKVKIDGQHSDMTLFHLRLQDLRNREFSLRRYCRDSGREVCHTTCKQQIKATGKRPGFSRSLSNALSNMRSPSGSKTPTGISLSRNDSGIGSTHSGDSDSNRLSHSSTDNGKPLEPPLTETIRLEFSNYAQTGVKRTGAKGNKRYDFEYWDVHYSWRRVVRRNNGISRVSFHLTKNGNDSRLAHITPVELDPEEIEAETERGGWIPPCRMWISDKTILGAQKDLSDVVVAAGLIALVDDSIRARIKPRMGVEYIGPKRLMSEIFSRTSSGQRPNTRPPTSRQSSRPTTSRQSSRPSTAAGGSTGSRVTSASMKQTSGDD